MTHMFVCLDSNKPVSMRRVDSLLSAAETLPFNFSTELEKLKEKKSQAKLWLEKMKKSFSAKANASEAGSRRKAQGKRPDDITTIGITNNKPFCCLQSSKMMNRMVVLMIDEWV